MGPTDAAIADAAFGLLYPFPSREEAEVHAASLRTLGMKVEVRNVADSPNEQGSLPDHQDPGPGTRSGRALRRSKGSTGISTRLVGTFFLVAGSGNPEYARRLIQAHLLQNNGKAVRAGMHASD